MSLRNVINAIYKARVDSGNINYLTGLTGVPASGAPGAYAKLLANATATVAWWLCALGYGNPDAAGAVVFDYDIARFEDGVGDLNLAAVRIHVDGASTDISGQINFPFPRRSPAAQGAAAQQTTASGKTLDVSILYATGVGT
ncbi:MAG: hypothetical protein PHI12_07755 [Dehalococcoidales bacterium]|nr:hypothetical protein [Dehalococcoidales bacterium]